jgi:hypothetical protein
MSPNPCTASAQPPGIAAAAHSRRDTGLRRVKWTSAGGAFVSHEMPLCDAVMMAATIRWAGAADAAVVDATL